MIAAAVVFVGVVVALVASIGSKDETPRATLVAPAAATPAPPTPQPLGAQELYDAIVAAPFNPGELPPGYSEPEVKAADLKPGARRDNLVGTVNVKLKGPDLFNYIYFDVHATQADAKSAFEHAGPPGNLTGNERPPGFEKPALCFHSTEQFSDSPGKFGETTCIVLVGSMIAWGQSDLQSNQERGDIDHAIALAKAAVAHAERVRDETRGPRGLPV